MHPVELRDRFHDLAEGDNVVCHGERVGVAQVDLLLAGRALMVRELGDNAHVLQGAYCLAAQLRHLVALRFVEVAALASLGRCLPRCARFDHVELNLGASEEFEAFVACGMYLAAQHVARVGVERVAVRHGDVAERPRGLDAGVLVERQRVVRRRVQPQDGSDSEMRLKPSIELPSKPTPSSNALSSSAGAIITVFRLPAMSVNQRRMNAMFCSSTRRRTLSVCEPIGPTVACITI